MRIKMENYIYNFLLTNRIKKKTLSLSFIPTKKIILLINNS